MKRHTEIWVLVAVLLVVIALLVLHMNRGQDVQSPEMVSVVLYVPGDQAENLIPVGAEVANEEDQTLLNALIEAGALPDGCAVQSSKISEQMLTLDMNATYASAVRSSDVAREHMLVYTVVNTFIQARGVEQVMLTVDGVPLESGRTIYDTPLVMDYIDRRVQSQAVDRKQDTWYTVARKERDKNGIMRKIRNLLCGVVGAACVTTAQAADGTLPILMYHNLTDDATAVNSMTVTDERFRLDMEYLQAFGYTPLQPQDLIEIAAGEKQMPAHGVMITFDDGYLSNYTLAMPLLERYGMDATISLVAYNIDKATENADDPARHTLTWNEVKKMQENGTFAVGLHTYNLHNPSDDPALNGMPSPDGIDGIQRLPGETWEEYEVRVGGDLAAGVEALRTQLGIKKVDYFSYPFGAYDVWFSVLLEKAGISISTTSTAGTADILEGLHQLPRYGINMQNPVAQVLRRSVTALAAEAKVEINGTETILPAYNIDGNNYVRVRDIAHLLSGTSKGYDVQWDEESSTVQLYTNSTYTPLGTEGRAVEQAQVMVQSVVEPVLIDGQQRMLAAFRIADHNFYQLRSLGEACGFSVKWDEDRQIAIVDSQQDQ